MQLPLGPSLVALAIQLAGMSLVAILSGLLVRSVPHVSLRYWTVGWTAMTVGLMALLASFWAPGYIPVLHPLYVFGGYVFGLMLIAGCRYYATGEMIETRHGWWLVPAAAAALLFPLLARWDLNVFFIPHAGVMAGLFFVAFRTTRRVTGEAANSQGLRIMSIALALLAIDFVHYVPVFWVSASRAAMPPIGYLQYTSLYDLILQILLGFGTVMLVTESVRRELEAANREVRGARDRLEVLARMDPLTGSLNRHAFQWLVEKHRDPASGSGMAGCAAIIDLDRLKEINDTYGHPAGDVAIRAVSKAISSLIRVDDLLFRWGGDEFLILLFGVAEADARARLARLNQILRSTRLPNRGEPVEVSVSYGLARFHGPAALDQAIARADREMYARKQSARKPRAIA